MNSSYADTEWLQSLPGFPRLQLALLLPTPLHRLQRFGEHIGGIDLWMKRDDLTGLAGGGNKTRKLEFIVGDAIRQGADTLVTVGAIQSNHTRQTAAAANRAGLACALLHCGWTGDAGLFYRRAGNILLSSLLGAELFLDEKERPIEDQGPLDVLFEHLRSRGQKPYLISGGASDQPYGGLGYAVCAAEMTVQAASMGIHIDYVVHCTGSSSTQAGLVAGFAAMGSKTRVIGIPDDEETDIKSGRVLRLANQTLEELDRPERVGRENIEIVVGDESPYGKSDEKTYRSIRLFSEKEGLIADPVYEGKAIRGLIELAEKGRFEKGAVVVLLHMGGTPAVHAYADTFGPIEFKSIPGRRTL
ncbi:MAG TPA: D-cysteine desulfhydrase family protein [Thermovirgaceae bacterium]|nr:D-cysteine desulfhydrase family protein [Thermovirgaceae bacterium]